MAAKKQVSKTHILKDKLNIVFYLILPLLLLPPFFKGLFFNQEANFAQAYIAVVLAVYAFVRKDKIRISRNLMDYAFIGLVIAYIISNFVALSQRAAIEATLRIFSFFVIYWILANAISGIKQLKLALSTMYLSGIVVAVIGLGNAYGTFFYLGAYQEGMINSTLQYHNAAAIFLVGCSIIGLYLAMALDSLWLRVLCGGFNYILLSTVYGAGSRGAMLVAPIGVLLLIVGQPKGYRLKIFYNFLVMLVPFVFTAKNVLDFGTHGQGFYWGWLLVGTLIGCALQHTVERIPGFTSKKIKRVAAGSGIAIAIMVVVAVALWGREIMPATVTARLLEMKINTFGFQERLYFYRDALSMVKDYPIFGAGGGGWNSAYAGYQTFLYYTTEVHSHPLQVLVETGILGFTCYVLLWIGLLITIVRVIRKVASPEYRAIAWTSAVGAGCIFLHSAIDFSLSLGAVAILMYSLIGICRGVERIELDEKAVKAGPETKLVARKIVGGVLAGVLFLISTSFYIATFKAEAAVSYFKAGQQEDAITELENATTFDPFNYEYPEMLAQLYGNLAYQQQNRDYSIKSLDYSLKTVKLNKRNNKALANLVRGYLLTQNPEQAVSTAEQVCLAAPWEQDSYLQLTQTYLTVADLYLNMTLNDEAREVLLKIVNMPEKINRQVSKLGPKERQRWTRGVIPFVDANLQQMIDEANSKLKKLK